MSESALHFHNDNSLTNSEDANSLISNFKVISNSQGQTFVSATVSNGDLKFSGKGPYPTCDMGTLANDSLFEKNNASPSSVTSTT